jgi:hypothetical protein
MCAFVGNIIAYIYIYIYIYVYIYSINARIMDHIKHPVRCNPLKSVTYNYP